MSNIAEVFSCALSQEYDRLLPEASAPRVGSMPDRERQPAFA
jgi:hypothetical protein